MSKKRIITAAIILVAIVAIALIFKEEVSSEPKGIYTVRSGSFEEVIKCKGEINSADVVEIKIPKTLDDYTLRVWSYRIMDIVDEGKEVKKGDFIAQLDQSQLTTRMREVTQDLERLTADLKNAVIDSTVILTQLREEIKDAQLDLEYNKIDLEQSVFESEAYQRKVQMNYQKAEIGIENKKRNYQLEINKRKVGIKRLENYVEDRKESVAKIQKAIAACRITSPDNGIVMLAKSPFEGKKYKRNDNCHPFMPVLAVLPNLDQANSEVYVKEIDISKVAVGDSARVSFDALEGVTLKGKVVWIASMGEDHKDFDMKVFKVLIRLEETDPGLKPAMTSNSEIIVSNLENVLSVPVRSVFSGDSGKFVWLKQGSKLVQQPVTTGPENEESIVITQGIQEGDRIATEAPAVM
ncbi:efflux RND transporter periplasmic adaptor subunit [Maribellus luteus]|nr:HlyD family efflux transporter periplasmic adaptor subunit [Maribellus luteus]